MRVVLHSWILQEAREVLNREDSRLRKVSSALSLRTQAGCILITGPEYSYETD